MFKKRVKFQKLLKINQNIREVGSLLMNDKRCRDIGVQVGEL